MNLTSIEQAENQAAKQQQPPTSTTISTDEQKINAANSGVFVQDATDVEIRQALAYCYSITGLNKEAIPNQAADAILIDFIRVSFPAFRIPEVRTAFTMNAAGRFGEVIEHYQNFSPSYFGKIMTAFRKKSQDLKVYQQNAKAWNQPAKPLYRSDEIPDEELVTCSFANYLKMKQWQLIYPGCYKTLEKYGYGLSADEGSAERKRFNSLSDSQRRGSISEDRETQFKKWLTAVVFNKFILEGRKDLKL